MPFSQATVHITSSECTSLPVLADPFEKRKFSFVEQAKQAAQLGRRAQLECALELHDMRDFTLSCSTHELSRATGQ